MREAQAVHIDISHHLKEIGRGAKGARDLSRTDAEQIFAAILDGAVDEFQLGALLLGMRIKGESDEELLGFKAALDACTPQLELPGGAPRLVVIPSYNGARRQPNLMPLLALLLARAGIPVLIHGRYDFATRVDPSALLSALGIARAESVGHASQLLAQQQIAFIDLAALLPGLDRLLTLRARLGLRNSGHAMVKLLDPLRAASVRIVAVTHPEYLDKMRRFLIASEATALLLRGTEGEVYANPRRTPQMESFTAGQHAIACAAAEGGAPPLAGIPDTGENAASTDLIRAMLAGRMPIPQAIQLQAEVIAGLSRAA